MTLPARRAIAGMARVNITKVSLRKLYLTAKRMHKIMKKPDDLPLDNVAELAFSDVIVPLSLW